MNITFLIGNGFDIGLGMKTKFTDFFPYYKEESKNKDERIKGLSENITTNEEDWSYFEQQLGKYTVHFTSETKQNYIDQVKDFEKGFVKYLQEQEERLNYDSAAKIAEKMKDALLNFGTTNNLQRESSNTLLGIFNNKAGSEHRYNFVNFNYTSALEQCLAQIKDGIVQQRRPVNMGPKTDKIGRIVHVHGTSTQYPIMGVNDASQIANPELAKDGQFIRKIVKPSINEMLRMSYDTDATALIENSTILCVYGMSLGVTDRKWWNYILNWLGTSGDHQLIVFVYDPEYAPTTPYDFIEREDALIEQLTRYSLSSVNADKMRKRIHIAIHKNIFEIDISRENAGKHEEPLAI